MVKIEINGITIEARDGATVIEAADEAGIVIPRFCYHKKLSIAANCRMCLVEVEKVAKPLPACATPVTEGMRVQTRSPKALAAQRAVMEFLLINHPLDCPICDQGGECDLQELAVGFGKDASRYTEVKRVVADPDLGPLVATDMTRCIHCTRCVRFGQEVAGVMEMGASFRGENTRIGTYLGHTIDSELSGNLIDLCPVGALTSKPYRFTARPWELKDFPSVSPHDCVGANLNVSTRRGQVMRVVPRENEAVNETWLSDRDRFSYTALEHRERLTKPRIKKDGVWQDTDWDTALTFAASGIKRAISEHGADAVGALGAYNATTEELYLLQRLMRGVGSGNVDYRLRQQDFRDQDSAPDFPWLGAIADIESSDVILLVGSNIRKDQPLLSNRVRKAAGNGGVVMAINPVDYEFVFPLAAKLVVIPTAMVSALAGVAKALLEICDEKAPSGFEMLNAVEVSESQRDIARRLSDSVRATILLGNGAAYHPAGAELRSLGALIARLAKGRAVQIAEGGNAAGAALAGALPHREAGAKAASVSGKNWMQMASSDTKAFVLLGVEPEFDSLDGLAMQAALQRSGFVVALNTFASEATLSYADVLLPVGSFLETSGTFVNGEGRWQGFAAANTAPGEVRPAWKVLRVMGNLLDVAGFDYMSSEEVLEEVRAACKSVVASGCKEGVGLSSMTNGSVVGLVRIVDFPLYATDPMVRRAAPLQATTDAKNSAIRLNPADGVRLSLHDRANVVAEQGECRVTMPVVFDARVPAGSVLIPAGQAVGMGAAPGFATVKLQHA